jgi:hypothetical protein
MVLHASDEKLTLLFWSYIVEVGLRGA